jgi:hypothetical protein
MGEIANMVLDGILDEETGELIDGTATGYPRRMMDAAEVSRLGNQAAVRTRLPFPCPGCGRSFRHKGDLKMHRRDKSH